jgi:hypothetical protein
LARLPEAFLALIGIAVFFAVAKTLWFGRIAVVRFGYFGRKGLYRPLLLARGRQILLVWVAVVAPVSFLIIQHATLYHGVRHTLFVIPMLAVLASWALLRLVPYLRRVVVPAMVLSAIYIIAVVANLVILRTVTDWYKQNVYDPQQQKIGEIEDLLGQRCPSRRTCANCFTKR